MRLDLGVGISDWGRDRPCLALVVLLAALIMDRQGLLPHQTVQVDSRVYLLSCCELLLLLLRLRVSLKDLTCESASGERRFCRICPLGWFLVYSILSWVILGVLLRNNSD